MSARRSSRKYALCVAFAAALVFAGCPERPAPGDRAAGDAQSPPPQVVRVVFELPGDDIGGPEAQALLEDVKAALGEEQAGLVLRSGFGMGEAEIVLQVQGDGAPEKIRWAIEATRPQAKYRIARGGQ